jgi:hypothetical protein
MAAIHVAYAPHTRDLRSHGDAPAAVEEVTRDPDARTYTDLALTPVRDDDDVTLDLLTKTTGARAAVAHVNKVNKLTRATVEGSHC